MLLCLTLSHKCEVWQLRDREAYSQMALKDPKKQLRDTVNGFPLLFNQSYKHMTFTISFPVSRHEI